LPAQSSDHVGVVRAGVAKHEWDGAVAGQAHGHAHGEGGLANPRDRESENRGVADQVRTLEPADRVGADSGTRRQVPAHGHHAHRGTAASPEGPQATYLHRGTPPLGGRLHIERLTTSAPDPPARGWTTGVDTFSALVPATAADHSFSLTSVGILECLGNTSPSGRQAAKALS